MKLTLYVADNCKACERVRKQLSRLLHNRKDVNVFIKNIVQNKNKNNLIVPALYIDEELYFLGDINEEKLLKKLRR